jgi:hypothetical protein
LYSPTDLELQRVQPVAVAHGPARPDVGRLAHGAVAAARHVRQVAVQVLNYLKLQTLKQVFHFIGSRVVETCCFQAKGRLNSTCTAQPHREDAVEGKLTPAARLDGGEVLRLAVAVQVGIWWQILKPAEKNCSSTHTVSHFITSQGQGLRPGALSYGSN